MLRCVTGSSQTSWSDFIPWIEYAHNSLVCSATAKSPFECILGYQPPLFPSQEQNLPVPLFQSHLAHCRRIWMETRAALLGTVERNKQYANQHRSQEPTYAIGQKVWLASTNIPLSLRSWHLVSSGFWR